MAYLKPQSPIKYKEDYIYPPTTIDQVIMPDGQRLSGVGVYLDRPDETDDTTLEAGINADTLGGVLASDYALKTDTIENAVNATNAENFSGYTVDALKAYILDLAHPIGSYYWSSLSTDPSTLFGGTWEQIKDRFILAAGDSYAVNSTGGAVSTTYTPTGSISGTALSISQIPSHSHSININIQHGDGDVVSGESLTSGLQVNGRRRYRDTTAATGSGKTHSHSFTGTAAQISTMPPYRVAYCWRRTA